MKKQAVIIFVAVEVIAFLLFGGIYAVGQQIIRQSANLLPLELVRTAEIYLSQGIAPSEAVSNQYNVDLNRSLSPFLMIYDDKQQPIAGNSTLNGQPPRIPVGVLDYAKERRISRLTWQPQRHVREAIAVEYFRQNDKGYYIVAGQALDNFEEIIENITILVSLLFVGFSIAVWFLGWMLLTYNKKNKIFPWM